jgi:hypothetical protein
MGDLEMVQVVTLSWLLIPATKSEGPIAVLTDWDPVRVVQKIHNWSGRIVVVVSLLHGFCHTLRLGKLVVIHHRICRDEALIRYCDTVGRSTWNPLLKLLLVEVVSR